MNKPTKEWLEKHYCKMKMTITEIAPLINKSQATVWRYIKSYGLPRPVEHRSGHNTEQALATIRSKKSYMIQGKLVTPTSFSYRDKKWLISKYQINKLSMKSVAKLCNVSGAVILKWLKLHGIPRRERRNFGMTNGNFNRGYMFNSGYKLIKIPGHPSTNLNGYIREHRYIMEKHLKRYLTDNEVVHHKDGNKRNNSIENLEIYTNSQHKHVEQSLQNFIKRLMYSSDPSFVVPYRDDLRKRFEDFLSKCE